MSVLSVNHGNTSFWYILVISYGLLKSLGIHLVWLTLGDPLIFGTKPEVTTHLTN